jgi:2-iminobutanoate/2-iminopropanoate deaminase
MKKVISTKDAPSAIGPYNQAIEANGFLFISGQIPVVPSTSSIVEGGISEQTEQALKNLGAVLKEAGLDYSNVVKTNCFISNMDNFKEMNAVYAKYFTVEQPARAAVEVSRLPLDVMIEIEAIAVTGR